MTTARKVNTDNKRNNNLPAKADLKVVKNDNEVNKTNEEAEELKKKLDAAEKKEKFFVEKLAEVQAKAKKDLEEATKPKVLGEEDIKKRIENAKFLNILVDNRNKISAKIDELKTFNLSTEDAQLTLAASNGMSFETVKTELLTAVKITITEHLQKALKEVEKQIASFEI